MYNYNIDYTGEPLMTSGDVDTPIQARVMIENGRVPLNLVELSKRSTFRDATLGYIFETTDHDMIIATFTHAMRTTQDSGFRRTYAEYLIPCAFSWDHKDVLLKAITDTPVSLTTNHVWSVVEAFQKQMPGVVYQTMMINQRHLVEEQWQKGF
jgi:hypothetical protein